MVSETGCAARRIVTALLLTVAPALHGGTATDSVAPDAAAPDAAALYGAHCAHCHDAAVYKAPGRAVLASMAPESILASLEDGVMREQAAPLAPEARVAIAELLAGRALGAAAAEPRPPACGDDVRFDAARVPTSAGWGVDARNA